MFTRSQHQTVLVLAIGLLAGYAAASGRFNPFQRTDATASDEAGGLAGKVQVAGSPVAVSTLTLYAAGEAKPVQLAQAKTGDDGTFILDVAADAAKDKVLYLVARGGTPKAPGAKGPIDALA